MKDNIVFSQQLENIQLEYLTGDFAKCWRSWGSTIINPYYNKFYYIMSGECYIKIDDSEYIAKKGQLFLLPCNSTQTYHHISDNTISKYWIHFTAMCNNKDLMEQITLPHFIEVKDTDYVTDLFKSIITNNHLSLHEILRRKAYILQLLAYYAEHSSVTRETIFKDTKLSVILTYIDENLSREISINELCSISHLHPNYFIRYFKEKTGHPPIEFINNLRINRAKKMLQTQNDPVQVIAYSVGFESSNYFSRLFKKKTGFSPSEYRFIAKSRPDSYDFD